MVKISLRRKAIRTSALAMAFFFAPTFISGRINTINRTQAEQARIEKKNDELPVRLYEQLEPAMVHTNPNNGYKIMWEKSRFVAEQAKNVYVDGQNQRVDKINVWFKNDDYNTGFGAALLYRAGKLDAYDKNPGQVDFTDFISAEPQMTNDLKALNSDLHRRYLEEGKLFWKEMKDVVSHPPKQRRPQLFGPN